MGVCATKPQRANKSGALLVAGKTTQPLSEADKIRAARAKAIKDELDLRKTAKWPKSAFTDEIKLAVWDQIRIRRHPRTEQCRNFLVQVCMIRRAPAKVPDKDYYSDLDPSGALAWYLTPRYNSYSHYLDKWEESRPTRLVPQSLKEYYDEGMVLLMDEPRLETGDVTWSYKRGEEDSDFDYTGYEMLVCPGRHVAWPKVSGVFGTEPLFPMHLMKGSIIKKLDSKTPFAIPRYEDAMKQGMLVAVSKVHKVRGEEADMEEPDLIRGGIGERVSSTAPYVVPVFELTEGRGFLSPTARIVFISHRWLTPDDVHPERGHPDDAENTKLRCLQKILKDDDFVFFDLWSIPQAPDRGEDRGKAIYSLNTYVDWCSEFIALCPTPENRKQYGERGWTNLELVSALTPVVKKVVVNKWNTNVEYGSTADRIGFVDASGSYDALSGFVLRNPKEWRFGHPEDAQAVVPVAKAVREKFEDMKKLLDQSGESYVGTTTFRGSVNVAQVITALNDI